VRNCVDTHYIGSHIAIDRAGDTGGTSYVRIFPLD
jgi:hypothetical protein